VNGFSVVAFGAKNGAKDEKSEKTQQILHSNN
jgi:hypothetical protein